MVCFFSCGFRQSNPHGQKRLSFYCLFTSLFAHVLCFGSHALFVVLDVCHCAMQMNSVTRAASGALDYRQHAWVRLRDFQSGAPMRSRRVTKHTIISCLFCFQPLSKREGCRSGSCWLFFKCCCLVLLKRKHIWMHVCCVFMLYCLCVYCDVVRCNVEDLLMFEYNEICFCSELDSIGVKTWHRFWFVLTPSQWWIEKCAACLSEFISTQTRIVPHDPGYN